MGGLLSRSKRPPRRVALVGLSETGKSHFLSVLCGDGSPPLAPTHGLDRVQYPSTGPVAEFVEFGWTTLALGANRDFQTDMPFDSIVWFIDEHDSLLDVQAARSMLLGFAETQPSTTALCIVLNKERPYVHRRAIRQGRWSEDMWEPYEERRVNWSVLCDFADTTALKPHFGGGVYATELSYSDPHAAALCLEWIVDPGTTDTRL